MTELLAPAGNMEALKAAIANGCDAVYLGMQKFGARAYSCNFDETTLREAASYAHLREVKVFVTMNTIVFEEELSDMRAQLAFLNEIGVDGVIVQDMAVFDYIVNHFPDMEAHCSTQMGIDDLDGTLFWKELGAERVVLAREVDIEKAKKIRREAKVPIEIFVHGALCVSYSGRCLLSNYMTGRDSNRGACAQPCRYQYTLMEEKRPGEYFPVFEDERGTYILNSRDMCMIDHLPDLIDAGVDCLKIEGRAKSAYYAAIVAGAYRHVLDDIAAGRPADPVWRDEVEHVSHRHYSTGFFYGQPGQYFENSRYIREWQICAVVLSCEADGLATLSLRNKFKAGDRVEIVGPDLKPFEMLVPLMEDADGLPLEEPRTPQMEFKMRLPRPVPPMSFVRHGVDLSGK